MTTAQSEGGFAFFFFFFGHLSPDFESDEFRNFCTACYRVLRFKPTLTLAGLQAVLEVVAQEQPVDYDEFSRLLGLDYAATTAQAGLLSDGRGNKTGLKLLKRVPGSNRQQKQLIPSRTGRAVASLFAAAPAGGLDDPSVERLRQAVLPALRRIRHEAPGLSLSALCILLFITQNNDGFCYEGNPAKTIAEALQLTNLPRLLLQLSDEPSDMSGLGLIVLRKSAKDRRVTIPALSDAGASLIARLAADLRIKPPSPIRKPKAASLRNAASPAEVRTSFDDDDFDIIWPGDEPSS